MENLNGRAVITFKHFAENKLYYKFAVMHETIDEIVSF